MITVTNMRVSFGDKAVVDDVSFSLNRGDRLAIIGESGSGKTMMLLAILGLLPPSARLAGSIVLDGRELVGLPERDYQHLRGNAMSCVFQEPATALNPTQKIGTSLTMALRQHTDISKAEAKKAAVELASSVGLPDPELIVSRYPHELSGGQRQRVVIAMAMSTDPDILLADEPTTALDATVQAKVLRLIDEKLGQDRSLILVTHDMAVAYEASDQLLVMKDGAVVETGPTKQVIASPATETTANLIAAARATGLSR